MGEGAGGEVVDRLGGPVSEFFEDEQLRPADAEPLFGTAGRLAECLDNPTQRIEDVASVSV